MCHDVNGANKHNCNYSLNKSANKPQALQDKTNNLPDSERDNSKQSHEVSSAIECSSANKIE